MAKSAPKRALVARILTLVTFLAGAFLLASLVTHSPGDPPIGSNDPARNLCGQYGAWVSHHLLNLFGMASFLLVIAGLVMAAVYVVQSALPRRLLVTTSVILVAAFLVLSLATFDAAHDGHRYDGALKATNACGMAGATVGYTLLNYAGIGIWLATVGLVAWLVVYVFRIEVPDKALRAIGVVLLACFLSAAITVLNTHGILQPNESSVLPVGAGGVMGRAVADLFLIRIGALGAYLILTAVAVVGLALTTDGWVLILPVALWQWARKRKLVRLEGIRDRSEKLRRGFVAAREAMAAGTVAGAAAVASAKTDAKESRKEARAEKKQLREERKALKRQAKDAEAAALEDETEEETTTQVEPAKKKAPKIRLPGQGKPVEEHRPAPGAPTQMRLADQSEAPGDEVAAYRFPSLDLLETAEEFDISGEEVFIRQNAANLEGTLKQFGVEAEVVGIDTGPVITQYEISLGAGIKVGKVISLSDDLAIGLKAPSVRIIAPLPGRGTIGIEVPNRKSKIVSIREAIEDGLPLAKRHNLPLFLGRDSAGHALVRDLTAMPHILIGGTTGSGKSVCLNTIITSILFTRSPRDVKLILVDPKMVEMAMFAKIPHLMCPVVSDMSKVYSILEWLIGKMQERYSMLAEAGVKNIVGYNALSREQIIERFQPTSDEDKMRLTYHMPYIILIVDELADLMMSGPREVESAITRLAQKSRAVGIHLVLATQRPSVDVVTGLIKSNHPCRIAFQMATRVDSRTILDSMGAEKLIGQGDMLLMQPGASKLTRAQGAFISEEEINAIVRSISDSAPRTFNRELVQLKPKDPKPARGRGGVKLSDDTSFEDRDDLYLDAVRVVLQHQRGSVSLLQRKLNIGYGRGSRLIDFMAEAGLVGDYQGSQAREVKLSLDEWEAQRGEGVGALAAAVGDEDDEDEL
jgi:DNA segregation ATPase FtsK/SpoIIIE, S-DNA-T family